MRKVYSLLSIQLAITTIIGASLLLTPGVKQMVQVSALVPEPGLIGALSSSHLGSSRWFRSVLQFQNLGH
jgi:FtsH-binding integral membrane protein